MRFQSLAKRMLVPPKEMKRAERKLYGGKGEEFCLGQVGFEVRRERLRSWRYEAGAWKRALAKGRGARCGDEWGLGSPREEGGQQGVSTKGGEVLVLTKFSLKRACSQRPATISCGLKFIDS